MKCTTSWASAASKVPSGNGRSSAEARSTLHVRMPLARRGDERLRRIDCRDRVRAEPPYELRGQRAGAAADVEHALSLGHSGEVREHRGERNRVAAHEAVIRLGGDDEHHGEHSTRGAQRCGR